MLESELHLRKVNVEPLELAKCWYNNFLPYYCVVRLKTYIKASLEMCIQTRNLAFIEEF